MNSTLKWSMYVRTHKSNGVCKCIFTVHGNMHRRMRGNGRKTYFLQTVRRTKFHVFINFIANVYCNTFILLLY